MHLSGWSSLKCQHREAADIARLSKSHHLKTSDHNALHPADALPGTFPHAAGFGRECCLCMTVRMAAVGMTWHCESQRLEGVALLARSSGQEGLPSSFKILTRASVTAGRDRQDARRWQAGCTSCKLRECFRRAYDASCQCGGSERPKGWYGTEYLGRTLMPI